MMKRRLIDFSGSSLRQFCVNPTGNLALKELYRVITTVGIYVKDLEKYPDLPFRARELGLEIILICTEPECQSALFSNAVRDIEPEFTAVLDSRHPGKVRLTDYVTEKNTSLTYFEGVEDLPLFLGPNKAFRTEALYAAETCRALWGRLRMPHSPNFYDLRDSINPIITGLYAGGLEGVCIPVGFPLIRWKEDVITPVGEALIDAAEAAGIPYRGRSLLERDKSSPQEILRALRGVFSVEEEAKFKEALKAGMLDELDLTYLFTEVRNVLK